MAFPTSPEAEGKAQPAVLPPAFTRPVRPSLPQLTSEVEETEIVEEVSASVVVPEPSTQVDSAEEMTQALIRQLASTIQNEADVFVGESTRTKQYLEFIEIAFDTQNVPYFEGLPGVGKTALINAVAAKRKMFMRTIIGSQMEPQDMIGLPVLKELPDGSSITEFTKPYWFYEVEQYALNCPEGAIVFIDEITTSPPPVQASMLTFLHDRRVGKFQLPSNVMIIAAGNPPHAAADGNQLAPPMANRLAHLTYEPSLPDWFAGMAVAFNREDLSDQEKTQRAFIISFLQQNQGLVNNMPDDPEEASKAWPSMRSWDNAARALGKISTPVMAKFTLNAFVGQEAADEYMRWLDGLRLPDLNTILADPKSFDWRSLKADALYLLMSNAIDYLTPENLANILEVFEAARKARKNDILYSLHTKFTRKVRDLYAKTGEDSRAVRLQIAHLFKDIQDEVR